MGNEIEKRVYQKGAIVVDQGGSRFANELDRVALAVAVNGMDGAPAWCVFGEGLAEYLHYVDPYDATPILEGTRMPLGVTPGVALTYLEDVEERGLLYEADTLEGLAEAIGVDAQTLAATVASGEEVADALGHTVYENVEERFGPTVGIEGKYYALKLIMARNIINEGPSLCVSYNYEVLGYDGEPVPRLYACGAGLTQGGAPHIITGGGTHLTNEAVGAYLTGREVAALSEK